MFFASSGSPRGPLGALLGRLGPSWELSWAVLRPSWGPLKPSWAILGHLGVSLAVLEAVLEAILAVWMPKRAPERQNEEGDFRRTRANRGVGGP